MIFDRVYEYKDNKNLKGNSKYWFIDIKTNYTHAITIIWKVEKVRKTTFRMEGIVVILKRFEKKRSE